MEPFFKKPEEVDEYFNKVTDSLLILKARITALYKSDKDSIEYFAFYESILTQVRALFIENSRYKNNYTVQVFLNKLGLSKTSEEIHTYLNSELIPSISIRDAIKISVDRFIVHYDQVSIEEKHIEEICREHLTDIKNEFFIGRLVDIISGHMLLSYVKRMNDWEVDWFEGKQ
ncbi:hypothetical protein [Paenibacillus sp. S25]|uniref:hypothetical protein n=1 Tax=Paenibacillus sp. S25 TaxID=2823905 RepID=UPI001C64EBB7|nr:hypothetical protein [Paenibacillus sp. S25]QYK63360.1 hypothetical protein KAI37_03693 [Paenibacillus sp. S25]